MKYLSFFIFLAFSFSVFPANAYTSADCKKDITFLPEFLLNNDTGAQDHLRIKGPNHFDTALDEALKAAEEADSAKACTKIIKTYLSAWRDGHLSITLVHPDTADNSAEEKTSSGKEKSTPSLTLLSEQTLLLTVPSFLPTAKAPLTRLLEENHDAIAARKNWIIDVQKNTGGSDSSYAPLLPWIMSNGWYVTGVEWRATEANIRNQHAICEYYYSTDVDSCIKLIQPVADAMRDAPKGSYVSLSDEALSFNRIDNPEPTRPEKVVIITGKDCASSCEQFLLAARQSFSVKLVGQRTHGSLDYSNLRPQTLPSGEMLLFYATSRSQRLPQNPVDVQGVIPDIYLPQIKEGETNRALIKQIREMLEK